MRQIRKLAVGGLVGTALTLGISGMASAAPMLTAGDASSTTSASPPTTAPSPTTPSTSAPSTTAPSGSSPSTTAPSGSNSPSPATPPKAKSHKSKRSSKHHRKHTLTGAEIWLVVHPHHGIDCSHMTKQVKRVQKADAAAGARLTRWQKKSTTIQKNAATKTSNAKTSDAKKAHRVAKRTKQATNRLHSFQAMQRDGQALIKRIESKCSTGAKAT